MIRQFLYQWIERAVPINHTTHTHTRLTALFSGTTWVGRYQKGKTNLDFTEARDSEWQWHQLGHMQVCTLLQTDNHASTPPLSLLQAGCPSCRPTNSIKALKATVNHTITQLIEEECSIHASSLTSVLSRKNEEIQFYITN